MPKSKNETISDLVVAQNVAHQLRTQIMERKQELAGLEYSLECYEYCLRELQRRAA